MDSFFNSVHAHSITQASVSIADLPLEMLNKAHIGYAMRCNLVELAPAYFACNEFEATVPQSLEHLLNTETCVDEDQYAELMRRVFGVRDMYEYCKRRVTSTNRRLGMHVRMEDGQWETELYDGTYLLSEEREHLQHFIAAGRKGDQRAQGAARVEYGRLHAQLGGWVKSYLLDAHYNHVDSLPPAFVAKAMAQVNATTRALIGV